MDLEELIDSIDIVEYISQFVELEEKNGEYWGLSPFSDEKTPSFSVRRENNTFYCFSSGIGGNVFTFTKFYYQCDANKAVDILKKYVGCDGAEFVPRRRMAATIACRKYMKKQVRHKESKTKRFPDDCMSKYEKRDDKLEVYQGVKNEKGVWITPAFPKLIYVLEEDNIHEDSKYFYLTKLCAKCSVKRLVPDYISEKMMLQNKIDANGDGHCFPCMGCRSFLTPYLDENGNPKYYGRFNQGVVTINLPDVGLSAVKKMEGITYVDDEQYQKRKEEIFWEIFEERLELCHKALRLRHERLLGTLSDASPIHWQNGGLARLKKGETIDKLLYGGYSTLSLGYAGLYECVKAMTGKSHTDDEVKPFALAIMQKMNDKCAEWKAAENIDYSLYGTPIESTTYKFARCLQKRFGVIEGITDRNYITNSYHVHVTEEINAFDKLRFESEFQLLSPGGAISYIETANLSDNVEAALEVIKYIYNHIMYAELNTKSDFCQECGYDGEIQIVENEDGKLVWECPNCGNRDRTKMNIARRTCGYIGVNDFNQGRTQEIKERYVHLGGD